MNPTLREELDRLKKICEQKGYLYISDAPEHSYEITACNNFPRALTVIEELTKALEYIKEHELYHGINQGVAHEQTVDKALSRAEQLMRGKCSL